MRNSRLCGIGVAAVLVGLGGCRATITIGGRAEEDFSETASFEDVGSLEVDWRNGTIKVVFDESAARLSVIGTKVVTAGSQDAADNGMERFSIDLLTRESFPLQMVLLFDAPSQDSVHYRADVEIVVPAAVALTITSRNSNIDIDGNVNDTSVTLNNGDVTIDGQDGAVAVVVENGNVEVDSEGGDVDVEIDVGTIVIDAHPQDAQGVRAGTKVGTVTLRVPADAAASLDLETDVGIVDADLSAFTVTGLVSRFRSVSATLNGGGGGAIVGKSAVGNVVFGSFD